MADRFGRGVAGGALHPLVYLLPNTAQLVDGVMERRQLVADRDQELELGLEVGLAGSDTRVLDEGKGLRLRLPVYCQTHLVGAWRRQRPPYFILQQLVPGDQTGIGIAHVPDEAVHPRFRRYPLFYLARRPGLRGSAGKGFDESSLGVQEAQGHFPCRFVLQVIGHDHAIGWIRTAVQEMQHRVAVGILRLGIGHIASYAKLIAFPRCWLLNAKRRGRSIGIAWLAQSKRLLV